MKLKRSFKRGIGRVYIDESGHEYPSVTTVLNATLAKGPWLFTWQDKIRKAAFHETQDIDKALAAPNAYRDSAGDTGTFYHNAVEAYLNNKPLDEFIKQDSRVEDIIKSIQIWEKKTQLEPLHVEHYIASRKYNYAGTIDLIAHQTDGRGTQLGLFDWKTGSLQDDALLQLAAYSVAYQEEYGKRPDKACFIKIDIDKKNIKEAPPLSYHEISEYFDIFLKTLEVWRHRTKKR